MLDLELRIVRPGGFSLELACQLDAQVTGIVGPSGCGKTTLLNALAGLTRPERGRIVCDGEVLFDDAAGVDLPPEQRGLGYVFQDGRLFPHLDVQDNLRFGRARDEGGIPLARVVEVLELEPLLTRRPRGLSGGERQRVALGRALLASPRLLLLDEPLAAVDPGLSRRILGLIARVRDAFPIPVLYVTHDLAEVLSLTTTLLVIDGGRRVGLGTIDDLARDPKVLRVAADLGLDNALQVEVATQDAEGGVTRTRCGESELTLPHRPGAGTGSRWVVHLRPEDVILATADQPLIPLSARNRLEGTVQGVIEVDERVFVEVAVPAGTLRSEVTRSAVRELGLEQGRAVRCLFKTSALRWGNALQ